MDNRPIGVFDSGIGGLTAVKELLKILPHEDIIYFGDTARVPYGSHSAETIREFALQDLSFLKAKNVKAVLVACGTVSSTSLELLQSVSDVPVIGVISAASEKAAAMASNALILATKATVSSHAFKREIRKKNSDAQVFEKACPLFVPLVENGYASKDSPITKMVVEEYLDEFKDQNIDTVILGCTHYPLLRNVIQDVLPEAKILEAGKEAADALKRELIGLDLCSECRQKGKREYYVSEYTESFQDVCEMFLGEKIEGTIKVQQL